MNKKQIGGLIIAAVLFIAVGVSSVLTNTFSERMLADSMEQRKLDTKCGDKKMTMK